MKTYKLLFVEENNNELDSFNDAIKEFVSKNSDYDIQLINANTLQDALDKLKSERYDIAIVDLKLRGDTPHAEGNDIINNIKTNERIPVIVYSDNLAMLDPKLKDNTDVYRVIERTSIKYYQLLELIISLLDTGVTELFGETGALSISINSSLHDLFWKHISHNWLLICEEVKDPEERKKILCRYLGGVLYDTLSYKKDSSDICHPSEFYYIPPVKSEYYSGGLITDDKECFMILNAACDMELRDGQRDTEHIILAYLLPLKQHKDFIEYAKNQSGKTKGNVLDFIKNKKGRFHFLPPYDGIEGFLIDFENLKNISNTELNKYTQFASITNSVLKNIIYRFGAFFSRQGQPDLNEKDMLERIIKVCSEH